MRINLIVLLFLLIAFSCDQATVDRDTNDNPQVDNLFIEWDTPESPGCALAIIKDGEIIYKNGYGMADLEHDIPISPATVFYIGSVSKQFVTMSILLLAEKGKINLDDPIQTYLPDFPTYEAPITIRNLIHHTSGIRDYLTLWNLAGNDYLDHIDEDAVYRIITRQKELNFTPGERYLYSNSCYFMLAMIVKKITGQSFREFTKENIFDPLGMSNSHFHDDYLHPIKNRAFSYFSNENGIRNLISRFDLVGSGGLYTNVEDLFLWDQNFYHNKLGKGTSELIETMLQDGILNNGESAGYAFALVNGEYRGLKTVSHSGSLAGYRAQLMRFPDQHFSVIILANLASFNPTLMAQKVAEVYLESEMAPKGEETQEETQSQSDAFVPGPLEEYQGKYYCEELEVNYLVSIIDEKLSITIRYNDPWTLEPVDKDKFSGQVEVNFVRDNSGEIIGLTVDAGRVKNLKFIKLKK